VHQEMAVVILGLEADSSAAEAAQASAYACIRMLDVYTW
jgi:hypothetical protein